MALGDRHRPGYAQERYRKHKRDRVCVYCLRKNDRKRRVGCSRCAKKFARRKSFTEADERIGRFSRYEELLRLQQAERYALGRILKGEVVRRSAPGVAKLIERGLVEMRDRKCFPSLVARKTFKVCACGRAIFHLVFNYHKGKCVL